MSAALRLFSAIIALFCLVGCSPSAATPTAAPAAPGTTAPAAAPTTAPAAQQAAAAKPALASPVSGEIVVFAASSLTDVFQDMATTFQQANPDARLTFNFGASS